jgi:hypothetical protein
VTAGDRVLVIGAQGVLGTRVARAFEDAGWTVSRGGRRNDGRPGFPLVDLDRPDTVSDAVAQAELVVNVVPDERLVGERVALNLGACAINVSALPVAPGRRLRAECASAPGVAVLNAGLAPGITNLVVADLLTRHPDADEVEIALTLSASAGAGRAGREFGHRHLTARRRHRTKTIPLPEPFGERRCLEFAEDERGWVGAIADGRAVHTYSCFAERPVHASLLALNRVGAMRAIPRAAVVAGPTRVPDEPSREPVAEWVAVARNGARLGARAVVAKGDYLSTAAATVVLADSLIERRRNGAMPNGCLDPEEAFELGELAPRLCKAGIDVVPQPVGQPAEPSPPAEEAAPASVRAQVHQTRGERHA